MAPSFLVSLVGLLLHSAPTLHHPIPGEDLQDRTSEYGQDSIRAHQHLAASDSSDRLRRQRRGEADGERVEGEQLTADAAADTLKKINPLTIADQVADRMRKNKQSPAGDREEPAKDFGYSVIVMAGDPIKLPIAVHGKGVRVVAKGAKTVDGRQRKIYEVAAKENKSPATEELADADTLYSVKQQKEVRVPKKYDVDPNFPVYDEDFNFVPDPFNGILDESYLQETGGTRAKGGREPHSILVRSNVFDEVDAETTPCGQSWREPVNNSTDPRTLADRTSDQRR